MASPPLPPSSPGAEGGGAISAGAAAVCCMCGDQGLPGELVRCRRCRVRLQHRYCSDLYPTAAAYRRCNWCLRVSGDRSRRTGHTASTTVVNKADEKRKSSSASDEERRQQQRHEGCSSRRTPAEPGHPVNKKQKADQEKMPPPPPPAPAPAKKEIVDDSSGRKEVMRAGKTRVNKVKVRRYKLLAEVISC